MFGLFGKSEAQRGKGRRRERVFEGDAARRGCGFEDAPDYIKIRDRKPHDFVARMTGPAITITVTRRQPTGSEKTSR